LIRGNAPDLTELGATRATATLLWFAGLSALSVYLKSWKSGDPYEHPGSDPNFWKAVGEKVITTIPAGDLTMTCAKIIANSATRGGEGFINTVAKESPNLDFFITAASVLNTAYRKWEDPDNPLSERQLRNIISLAPFSKHTLVHGTVNNWIRGHVEESGGDLLKTKEDKYWEGE
jgi:hypothetical protein